MTDCKRAKKDTRSSITFQLPAAYAEFVAGILERELDDAQREGSAGLAATLQDILNPLRNAIELEEKKRALRGQQSSRKGRAEEPKQYGEQAE